MTGKNKGEWPYHEDPHGNWVACSSNPCKLHSGGDIMATSPEDAFAKAHAGDAPAGMTSTAAAGGRAKHGAAKPDGNMKPLYGDALKERRRLMDARVDGFIAAPVRNPQGSGTEVFEGGRFQETRDMDDKDVAKLIRADVKKLKAVGAVPSDWKVSVRTRDDRFSISMDPKDSKVRPLRGLTPGDIINDDQNGGFHDGRYEFFDHVGSKPFDDSDLEEFCREHDTKRVPTMELQEATHYLNKVAAQYAYEDTDVMHDYYFTRRTSGVSLAYV